MAAKALYRREAPLTNHEDTKVTKVQGRNIFLRALRAFVVKLYRAPRAKTAFASFAYPSRPLR
jgi:hypothetical protein